MSSIHQTKISLFPRQNIIVKIRRLDRINGESRELGLPWSSLCKWSQKKCRIERSLQCLDYFVASAWIVNLRIIIIHSVDPPKLSRRSDYKRWNQRKVDFICLLRNWNSRNLLSKGSLVAELYTFMILSRSTSHWDINWSADDGFKTAKK